MELNYDLTYKKDKLVLYDMEDHCGGTKICEIDSDLFLEIVNYCLHKGFIDEMDVDAENYESEFGI